MEQIVFGKEKVLFNNEVVILNKVFRVMIYFVYFVFCWVNVNGNVVVGFMLVQGIINVKMQVISIYKMVMIFKDNMVVMGMDFLGFLVFLLVVVMFLNLMQVQKYVVVFVYVLLNLYGKNFLLLVQFFILVK